MLARRPLPALGTVARRVLSPVAVHAAALEIAWTATHLGLYAFGTSPEHLTTEPVRQLTAGGTRTPVLLVHGLASNRSIFSLMRRSLRRRGFEHVLSFNYGTSMSVAAAAAQLAARVEEIVALTRQRRIHVVGHSLGGIVARYYVQRLGGDKRVHTLVTLGSPHRGTLAARLLPHPLVRQLRPDSPLQAELAEPAPGCRTRFIAVSGNLDPVILPTCNARLEHPDLDVKNVLVRGGAHVSLVAHPTVLAIISTSLAQPQPRGA